MPRSANLYAGNHSSLGPSKHRHRRTRHSSYLHLASTQRSSGILRAFHRPRTLPPKTHKSRPSIFGRHSQSSYQPSVGLWRSRFGFRSRRTRRSFRPLTLEGKRRVRRFNRQTRPQATLHTRPQPRLHTGTYSSIHGRTLSKRLRPVRKRDKLRSRWNIFASGKY